MNDKDLNIALGKLFNGIELKAEKVELAVADELEAVLKAAQNNKKFSKSKVDEAATINKAAYRILQEQAKLDDTADKINKNAENLWKEFSKAARDLGINPRETPSFKVYNEILENLLTRSDEKSVSSVLTMRLK
jgi:hypothetical protein